MWENILVTGLILNFGCNNTLLSEGHNLVSSQENSGSNTLYKNKLHLWIWMTTFGRSTKSWCLRSPQLHQQDKKYSERMIFSKLRRMLLGTGQCNLIMVLKQLEGFLLATHYCRNTAMSQKDDRPFSLKLMENPHRHLIRIVFWSGIGRNGQKMPIFGPKWPKMHILDQFWPFLGQKS